MNGESENRPNMLPLIIRHQATSDENPPWAGISFTEPVDSDVLAEQLRKRYPEPIGRTLRERKHLAAIDFLRDELKEMQKKTSPFTTSGEEGLVGLAGLENHFRKISRSGSNVDDAPGESSRRESVSASNTPESSLHLSVRVDHGKQSIERSPSAENPPLSASSATAGQQFVFSAVDLNPRQPKTKRKMTTEERSAYKETRKRGACLKCRRQKGRCTHGSDIDAVMEARSPDGVRNATKRRNSDSPCHTQLENTKAPKLEPDTDIRSASPVQHHPAIQTHQNSNYELIKDLPSAGPSRPVPGGEQSGGTVIWDQPTTTMYVNPTPTMEPHGAPLQPALQQTPDWNGFSPVNPYMPTGFPEQPNLRHMFQASPPLQGSDMFSYDSSFPFEPPWPNTQASHAENDDPP